ncbi:DUF4386 domain-containing protein [uncultured Devosia sp.]|uniref:DUF4386 domain-containing protein n=1 Tax=uncultured Devosia sp. TaxID=211434 RepID=UPI00262F40BB|nr:DUF4386 domain-containing protein [uncultured Devosia sp.]
MAQRWHAAALGGLLIAAIACGVLSSMPDIDAPDYFERLAAIETGIIVAALFQVAMALAYAGVIAFTFPLVRAASQTAAMAYLTLRTIGASFLFMGVVALLLFTVIGDGLRTAASPEQLADYAFAAEMLRQGRDWLNHVGMILPWATGGVLLYWALWRLAAVPRWLAFAGLVGAALTLIATILYIAGQIEVVSAPYLALNAPAALAEIVLALTLIVRGYDPGSVALVEATVSRADLRS